MVFQAYPIEVSDGVIAALFHVFDMLDERILNLVVFQGTFVQRLRILVPSWTARVGLSRKSLPLSPTDTSSPFVTFRFPSCRLDGIRQA